MAKSRRGRIKDLLDQGRSEKEILSIIDLEFPVGTFKSTNAQALSGTKWDMRKKISRKSHVKTGKQGISAQNRSELVELLKSFQAEPIIDHYRKCDLSGKTASEILVFSVDNTIYRAFHHETPSRRYRAWRWHKDPDSLVTKLNNIRDQKQFDHFASAIAESLVVDWGPANDIGEPTRMNMGIALKITNLVLKHLTFSSHTQNSQLIEWLHVPWDSFTLKPLRKIWMFEPSMPKYLSQGFVNSIAIYQKLHSLISGIANEAGKPRIHYEFFSWDLAHLN